MFKFNVLNETLVMPIFDEIKLSHSYTRTGLIRKNKSYKIRTLGVYVTRENENEACFLVKILIVTNGMGGFSDFSIVKAAFTAKGNGVLSEETLDKYRKLRLEDMRVGKK